MPSSLLVQVGASGIDVADLPAVLKGVLLDVAAVVLDAPSDPLAAAKAFAELAEGQTLAAGTNLGVDPVGARVRVVSRRSLALAPQPPGIESSLRRRNLRSELGCRALVVDGTAVHDLGASDVQELGYVLALGAHYLRALDAAGITVDDAAGLVEFRLSASADQFVTIAKLRAVRRMWARMLELSGASEDHRNMSLHAVTSRPMMTKHDPWVNMLRTCVAAFAAGVGGADAVTVLPFDARLGLPDAFARRIARNTSTLLVEESHVAKVADPAGGAFAVEKLTDDLAVAGWEELGRIESAGGVTEALDDGSLRGRIDEVVAERDRQIAKRTRPLTGLTEFPNLHETLPERKPYAEGALPVRPYGEPFEALRDDPADDQGLPRHDGHDRGAHRAGQLRHQPVRRRRHRRGQRGSTRRRGSRAEGLPGTGRRPVRRLPGRRRQGVRRVGRRPREGAARGRCRMGRARRPPRRGRRDRRHLRHGRGRARVPAAHEGEAGR